MYAKKTTKQKKIRKRLFWNNDQIHRMARQLTAEDVLELIEIDEQDLDEGDEIFFDGSDEEFG